MNQSTYFNYNLPQPNDPADISKINTNFANLDAYLHRTIGEGYSDTDNLDTRVSALEASEIVLEKSAVNSFDDGIDSYFKKVVSSIVPVQAGSGTPSPSNPRAISGFTECTVTDVDDISSPTQTNTATISFGSAGTVYGGYVDLISGKLVVEWGYLEPTEVYRVNQSGTTYYWLITASIDGTNGGSGSVISSHFEPASGAVAGHVYITGNGHNLIAVPTDQTLNTKELADTWVQTNNPQFAYKLATPQEYQLTPAQLRSLVGTNNLTSSTGEVTEVKYIANTTIADIYDQIARIDLEPDTSVTNVISFSFEKPKRDCRFYFQVFDGFNENLIFEASAPLNLDTMDITATYQSSKFPQCSSEWYCGEGSFVLDVGDTTVIEISVPAIYKMKSYIKYVVDGSQPDIYDYLSIIIGNLGANAVIKGYLK